jgi:hypothetical protein
MSTFTEFAQQDIVQANQTIVTTGMWSGDDGTLGDAQLYLFDDQLGKSGEYYFDIFDEDPNVLDNDTAEVQFAVSYGHINGGGAPTIADDDQAKLPTKTIYSQYRNLLLSPSETKFIFETFESDHIYVINIQRARVREQLDPGNWQLPLSGANTYGMEGFVHTFIDDSNQTLGAFSSNSISGRVFKVISGSIANGEVTKPLDNAESYEGKGYGLVYPDLGIIVLNPDAICPAVGFYVSASSIEENYTDETGSVSNPLNGGPIYTRQDINQLDAIDALPYAPITGSIAGENWGSNKSAYNHAGLFASLKLGLAGENSFFRARSAETISSTHYFVRLRNADYNYSNNPTYSNPDDGTINQPDFRQNPIVYVTTVGLYNSSNELLAVAKLSKPVRKSSSEEILLRIRLDF